MDTIDDNTLVPLNGFMLPRDFAWRVRFIAAIDTQLRRLRSTGHFRPTRFFGYFFQAGRPVGVTGSWVVSLEPLPELMELPASVDLTTGGVYRISAAEADGIPDYLLVHDSRDGTCWLWRFPYGLRFVEATDPVEAQVDHSPGS